MAYRRSAMTASRMAQALSDSERYQKSEAEKARWEEAEGPIPSRMWENSNVIASFDPSLEGCRSHIRQYGEGTYLQTAEAIGWRFAVVIRKEQ